MDLLETPLYNAVYAAKLSELSTGRVLRWLRGYDFKYSAGPQHEIKKTHKEPIIARISKFEGSYASFLDLIDLLFVKRFLDYGVSLQKIRKAFEEAKNIVGGHHFAQKNFFTDGRNIYLQVKNNAEALLELLSDGQWVIASIIKELAYKIEFDKPSGFAKRWYPCGQDGLIVIDPFISFGNPSIIKRGTSTAVVYDNFIAENKRIKKVCTWMNLSTKEVEAAIAFEEKLKAS